MIFEVLIQQIIVMFLLIGLGYGLFAKQLISKQTSVDLGNLLLRVVMPLVIFQSFWVSFTSQRLQMLLYSLLFSALGFIVSIGVSWTVFKNQPVDNFASSFSNAGFIGIPLVQAALGNDAVFMVASFIAFSNILQWTYGVLILTKDKHQVQLKTLIKHPVILAFFGGIILFLFNIPKIEILDKVLVSIGALNTPIAMIILGGYLRQSTIKRLFTTWSLYWLALIRLIIIPLLTLLVLMPFVGMYDVKLAILLVASTPVASNAAIFANKYNHDQVHGANTVCLTTLISVITVPLMTWIATGLL